MRVVMDNNKKIQLAMQVIGEYSDLERVVGYEQANTEMGHLLGEYVLRGELNEFEVDLITTVAVLGNIATHALNENEKLR
jgi:hypothetical protein